MGNELAELEASLLAEIMENTSIEGNEESIVYNAYEDAGGRMEGMRESVTAEL